MATRQKLDPNRLLVATRTFGTELRTIHRGDKVRASDPWAIGNPTMFVEESTPVSEWGSMWDDLPDPPRHEPHVHVAPSIEPRRQVRAKYDAWLPANWAPGSIGKKRGVPPPFGSAIRAGQVFDIAEPRVVAHPEQFETTVRDLTPEDVAPYARK